MANSSRNRSGRQDRAGAVRIIGGHWRGRKIAFDDAPGLRPTPDRVRETLFNWLAPSLYQAKCLDLFAGSGVLGFEALSRGAASVIAVEQNPAACKQLAANASKLEASGFSLARADAFSWLATAGEAFDIVFLDPPFGSNPWPQLVTALHGSAVLTPGTLVYLERPVELDDWSISASWEVVKEKTAASVRFGLYHCSRLP